VLNSDRFQNVLGRNVVEVWRVETNEQKATRLSAQRDYARRRRMRLSSRPIVDRLLIAVGHTVVALLKLPMRPRRVCLRDVIVIVSGVGLATILK